MIEAMVFLAGLLIWVWLLVKSMETRSLTVSWVCGGLCFLGAAWALAQSVEQEQTQPCAQYETRPQYNAATKTLMPMRVCVLRGEWVTESSYEIEDDE
jgi:hypothetical protein